MALKNIWKDLVENESDISAEDINNIAHEVIALEETNGDIEAALDAIPETYATKAALSNGEIETIAANGRLVSPELYVGENDEVYLGANGIYLSANEHQEICVGGGDEVVIDQRGVWINAGAKLYIEGEDVIGDISTALDIIISEQESIIAIQNALIGGVADEHI